MKNLLYSLHKILFDEDKTDEINEIVRSIISTDLLSQNPDLFSEFGSTIKVVFCEPDKDPLFNQVIEKVLETRNSISKENLKNWQEVTDLAIDLLLHKYVYSGEMTNSENTLMYDLYKSLCDTYPDNYEDKYWVSIIKGFANCTLELGKATKNTEILKKAILLYKQALEILRTGLFPDYWQINNITASAQLALVYTIIESYEIDKLSFANEFESAGETLNQAIDTYLISGTDFHIGYSEELQKRYEKLKG